MRFSILIGSIFAALAVAIPTPTKATEEKPTNSVEARAAEKRCVCFYFGPSHCQSIHVGDTNKHGLPYLIRPNTLATT